MRIGCLASLSLASVLALVPDRVPVDAPKKFGVSPGTAASAVALALAAHTAVAPPVFATAPKENGATVFTANKGGRIVGIDVDVSKLTKLARNKAVQSEVTDVVKALSPALKVTPPADTRGFVFELLSGRARATVNGEPLEVDTKFEPGAIQLTVRSRLFSGAKLPPGAAPSATDGDPKGTQFEQVIEDLGLFSSAPSASNRFLGALTSQASWNKPRPLLAGYTTANLAEAGVAFIAAAYAASYAAYTSEIAAEEKKTAEKKAAAAAKKKASEAPAGEE